MPLRPMSPQLEQVEGSGLFLMACIMEHDCAPNCRCVFLRFCWEAAVVQKPAEADCYTGAFGICEAGGAGAGEEAHFCF